MLLSRPLIYIAALPRTGSTLLSELLTKIPYSYILHEPHLGKNFFAPQKVDESVFYSHGIDIRRFLSWRLPVAFLLRRIRFLGYPQDFMIREFKRWLLPEISNIVAQVGVKEIRHAGWENYRRHFTDMKVIVTARDPRDIYLSLANLWEKGNLNWSKGRLRRPKPFSPETVADELIREFSHQKALIDQTDHMRVRYEDLCRDPGLIDQIKEFTVSPLPETGAIGAFTSQHPRKQVESRLHAGEITSRQIFRWKRISDQQKLREIHRLAEKMSEYREFWGYV